MDGPSKGRRRFLAGLGALSCAPSVFAPAAGDCVVIPMGVVSGQSIVELVSAWSPVGQPWLQGLYLADLGVQALDGTPVTSGNSYQRVEDQSGKGRHCINSETNSGFHATWVDSDPRAGGRASFQTAGDIYGYTGVLPSFTFDTVIVVIAYGDGTETEIPKDDSFMQRISGDEGYRCVLTNFGGPPPHFYAETTELDPDGPSVNGGPSNPEVLPLPLSVLHFESPAPVTQLLKLSQWDGPVFGYAFLNGAGADDAERMVGWMAHRAGIEASLVSGHPYRDSPP